MEPATIVRRWTLLSICAFSVASLLLRAGVVRSAGGIPVDTYVDCSCDDIVGQNLCFTGCKEKLRQSAAFRLVDQHPDIGVSLHLVCLDPDSNDEGKGDRAVVSTTYTTSVGPGRGRILRDLFRVPSRYTTSLGDGNINPIKCGQGCRRQRDILRIPKITDSGETALKVGAACF